MQRFRKHSQPARLLVGRRPDSFASHNASCSRAALVSMANRSPLASSSPPTLVAASTAACRLEAADQNWPCYIALKFDAYAKLRTHYAGASYGGSSFSRVDSCSANAYALGLFVGGCCFFTLGTSAFVALSYD